MAQDTHAEGPLGWSTQEFGRCWTRLPNKGIFFGLLAAWVVLFHFLGSCQFNFTDTHSLFLWMWGAWSAESEDSNQGKIIPIVVLVLLWVKRERLLASIKGTWWPALLPLAVCLALQLAAYVIQQPRVSIVALFVGLYCLVGVVWGWRAMRASFFPFFLFAFCMPLGTFAQPLTQPLRLVATTITAWITHGVLGISVIQRGTQLFDAKGTFNYDVAAACSGIRSFVALLAITTIFSMLTYRSYWRRAVMISMILPLSIVCNVLRLVAIILATMGFGHGAGTFVHEWFGFVTYAIALTGLLLAARALREPAPVPVA